MPDQLKDIGTILFAIITLVGVLVLAYLTTRWLSSSSLGRRGKGIIEILDRQPAAQDKSLLVVRVGKKILLVGVSSQNITKLTELDEDDISAASSPSDQDFASALKSALGRRLGGRNWEQTDSQDGSNTGRYEDK
ncbi:MAG: flagellar biosynthetic protein FliO [Clostridiales bacterium]|jgi:flagellar biosynthetic protein FliO|nr:flagellar biosynthetic protein FliO [Clostridiales bacterium]